MPDVSPELVVLAMVVLAIAAVAIVVPMARANGNDDDDPICWPESPDYHGDAAFFERRRRLEKQQRRFRALKAWKYWGL